LKLDCKRKELYEAVSMAAAGASTRTSVNILTYLKIDAKKDGVRIIGCDGEMWVERIVGCVVEKDGAICLPARLLVDLLASMPEGDVSLATIDGQGVVLQQGASEYRLQSLEPTDFPEPPAYTPEAEITIPMGELRKAVDSVSYAVSTDQHRQILTGVLLHYDGARLTLVATDTHRLAVRKLDLPGSGAAVNAVIPDRALKAIKLLPVTDEHDVTIKFGAQRVGVETAGAKVVSQLVDGTFPNWERVVPTEFTRTWSVERDQLEEKVNRAMILARDNANRVRFKGESSQVVIAARSEEKGEAKEEVPIVGSNPEIEVAFNGRYVTDTLKAIEGPGVRIEMTEPMRPAIFRPADDDDAYFCVIMPMQLA